ncbi:MAG: ABC transporter permease [Acidaminococcales bacterium]|jgi:ABC-2 type transport system permease protein|nr:ABC transporter permease [Acidaminococcales bacterium]
MTRLTALIKKEFIQMRRDRITLAIMVVMPLFQVLIFGFAINTDVKHLAAAVFDQSLSRESREFIEALTATEYYDITCAASSLQEITDQLQAGGVKAGIIIPPDYAAGLKNGRGSQVQVIVDATDSIAATSAINTAQLVGESKSREILVRKLRAAGIAGLETSALDVRIRPWYNPDFITAFYMVPGLCATILTLTMILTTSLAIIRERERGTLEQLMVTPLRPYELMLGKIIPYIAMGYTQLTVLLLAAKLVFGVPFQGSVFLLYLLTGLFITASLGLGLFISNTAKTQMQGIILSFSFIMPSVLLSGFMFPREAMPTFFYYLGYLVPITFYLKIIRGIVLKGASAEQLWPQILVLCAFIAIVMSVSILRFKKRLD